MYPAYREMDITRFNESMNRRYDEFITEMKLHKIRENKKLSQVYLTVWYQSAFDTTL